MKDSSSIIFSNIPPEQQATILAAGKSIILAHKDILFHQGQPANTLHLVVVGRLKLYKVNQKGDEVIIRYIEKGELTAAVAIIRDDDYPVTAEAVGQTEVINWDKDTLDQLMRDYPTITINLLKTVAERVTELQQRYQELVTIRVEQRIARSILRLMEKCGVKQADGILIDFPLSREDIANFTGTTLYTVSRTMSAWSKKGWLKSGREKITITDPHSLMVFAEDL